MNPLVQKRDRQTLSTMIHTNVLLIIYKRFLRFVNHVFTRTQNFAWHQISVPDSETLSLMIVCLGVISKHAFLNFLISFLNLNSMYKVMTTYYFPCPLKSTSHARSSSLTHWHVLSQAYALFYSQLQQTAITIWVCILLLIIVGQLHSSFSHSMPRAAHGTIIVESQRMTIPKTRCLYYLLYETYMHHILYSVIKLQTILVCLGYLLSSKLLEMLCTIHFQ